MPARWAALLKLYAVAPGLIDTDILAGVRAGCRTILVNTGLGGKDGKVMAEPDFTVSGLPAAVSLILAA